MAWPITVNVGPLATASATNIGASQAAAGAQYIVLNGAATDVAATAVAAAQAVAGAGNLTLNGTMASSAPTGTAVAYLTAQRRVYVTSAGNDSGITFTIYGTNYTAFGQIYSVVETVTGANASTVSTSQQFATVTRVAASAAAAANVSVGMSGVATLDTPRRVILTSGGNDTGRTFTIFGTADGTTPISEAVTGASGGAASSALIYKTITGILTSGAVATTITAGTNGVSTSRWVRFDDLAGMAQVGIQATVTGTVSYTIQQTFQDPNDPISPVADESVVWVDSTDTAVVAATTTKQSRYDVAPVYARVVLNSGTGSVSTVFRQVYTG